MTTITYTPTETWAAAIRGLRIYQSESAVIVDDGTDRWACLRSDWDRCSAGWDLTMTGVEKGCEDEAEGDAYTHLCAQIPCLTREGQSSKVLEILCALVRPAPRPLLSVPDAISIWGHDIRRSLADLSRRSSDTTSYTAEWIDDADQTWHLPCYRHRIGDQVVMWSDTSEAGVDDITVEDADDYLDDQVREYAQCLASILGVLVE